jgi:hypothetical protein
MSIARLKRRSRSSAVAINGFSQTEPDSARSDGAEIAAAVARDDRRPGSVSRAGHVPRRIMDDGGCLLPPETPGRS